ncbi:ATP-binding protein [Maliponia aquimaris]|uniref:histidine kinase n=1 Tax=Maliponia aquimaris TaxID=1673631 RepID=A0A238KZC7_9RHOB|nr:ATP-binding protein [Maliponia aquimaris]SMX48048.1 Blue-light-activated protein [Maliponia aquimaris]
MPEVTGTVSISIIYSMIALMMVGALLYPLFSQPRTARLSLKTSILVGGAFSISDAGLMLTSIVIEDHVFLNASAGLLLFAGYLGGPVAGLMALLTSLALRAGYGGEMLHLGMVAHTAYMLAGLVLRRVRPMANWPQFPSGLLGRAVLAFLLFYTAAIGLALLLRLAPDPGLATRYLPVFYLVGTLSVTGTWFVVRQSWRVATLARENTAMLKQLELIFETCGIGAFRYDGETAKLDFHESFQKLYGTDGDPKLHPSDFARRQVHPDDQSAMQAYIAETITGTETQDSHLFRAYRNDGALHHMRSNWKLEGLTPTGKRNIIGLHVDVTDVVVAQRERTRALEHIAAIAENVPGGIYESVWEDGEPREVLYVSPKCAEIWGLSVQDALRAPYLMAARMQPEAYEKSLAVTRASVETGQPGTARLSMKDDDGKTRWIDFRVQAVAQPDNTHHVYGIFVDVTSEVAALEEARKQAELVHQAQKTESIGQLTGGVAHDFNNILAIVMGNLELLQDEITDPKHLEMINAGLTASQRGAGLTRSLLAFARRARLQPEVLDLNAVVRQAKTWMARALPESIEVETVLLAGLWPVRLDAASLESALLNLILNARDAMDGHGQLTIETANMRIEQAYVDARNDEVPPGRYVMLAVTDTGSGIDPETLGRIFEPFFTTKAPGAGSGVGLSMVQGFVRQSGGSVQVYTEPGHGTCFKLYFPVADVVDQPVPEDQPAVDQHAGTASILLVEDDDSVRAVLTAMLASAGYHVTAARNGDAAYDLVKAGPGFDVVVTDIVMPGSLQGTHLARMVRNTHPKIPFVFMSGYAAEATVHGNGLRPQDIRLMKPVPKSDLLRAVAQALMFTRRA